MVERLRGLLNDAANSRASLRGVALHVDSPRLGVAWEGAAGLADPDSGTPMTPAHPVRVASNTKTYIAAAVLRAWEERLLNLDEPIAWRLPDEMRALLEEGGYRPDAITVRHLLTHSSGLDEHAGERWAEKVMADPGHRWSRLEQLQICVAEGRPRGEPGRVYRYSDTGYVLLGEILEQATGRSLPEAVWSLVDRDRLGLTQTWFESLEPTPAGVAQRARQFYGDLDVSDFDPSFDLWGGGGIATTVRDLARFFRALFTGDVFRDPATLETMLTTFEGLAAADDAQAGSLPPGSYRMGLWVLERDGCTLYQHGGFWGTSATYVPELDLVVTATVNEHEAGGLLDSLVNDTIDLFREAGPPPPTSPTTPVRP